METVDSVVVKKREVHLNGHVCPEGDPARWLVLDMPIESRILAVKISVTSEASIVSRLALAKI